MLIGDLKTREEINNLGRLLDAGATVACCESMPSSWPIVQTIGAGDESTDRLRKQFRAAEKSGKILDHRGMTWAQSTKKLQSVQWPSNANQSFQHRRLQDDEIYFVVNHGSGFAGEMSFPHAKLPPELWDAHRGTTLLAPEYRIVGERTFIRVNLEPFNSAIVVFSDDPVRLHVVESAGANPTYSSAGKFFAHLDQSGRARLKLSNGPRQTLRADLPAPIPIPGTWKLFADKTRCHGIASSVNLEIDRLVSWREWPALKNCAGIVKYSIEFDVPKGTVRDDLGWILDLGKVYQLADVTLNQQPVGTSWTEPYRLDVTPFLREGRNTLMIDVPNQLEDRVESAEHSRPSGLLGPVTLRPYGKILIKSK